MERHIEIACFEAAAANPYAQFESQDILVLLRIIAELEEQVSDLENQLTEAMERM